MNEVQRTDHAAEPCKKGSISPLQEEPGSSFSLRTAMWLALVLSFCCTLALSAMPSLADTHSAADSASLRPATTTAAVEAWPSAQDPTDPNAPSEDDDTSASPLFYAILFAVCLVFIGVGIVIGLAGIVLAVILAVVAAVLTSVGVLSTSVLAGIAHRRAGTAIKVLLIQLGALAGGACGVFAMGLLDYLLGLSLTKAQDFWIGGLVGLAGGATAIVLLIVAWSKLVGGIRVRLLGRRSVRSKVR